MDGCSNKYDQARLKRYDGVVLASNMSNNGLKVVVVAQGAVICVLAFLLYDAKRPDVGSDRVESAVSDVHGALAVGANYTQLQEKVQALASAVDVFKAKGGRGDTLQRYEQTLQIYKDSLDLWRDMVEHPYLYKSSRWTPLVLARIAKQYGVKLLEDTEPIPDREYLDKTQADALLQMLWARADETARGVKNDKGANSKKDQRR